MNTPLDAQKLNHIFGDRPDILAGISKFADSSNKIQLFNDISHFLYDRLPVAPSNEEPASKRRKVVGISSLTYPDKDEPQSGSSNGAQIAGKETIQLAIHDIPFLLPLRKKLWCYFTAGYIYVKNTIDAAPSPDMIYSWTDFEYALYVPVPDKAQEQYNYFLFPSGSYLPAKPGTPPPDKAPLVFTLAAGPVRAGGVSGTLLQESKACSDSYLTLFNWAVEKFLRAAGNNNCQIVGPDPSIFKSSSFQARTLNHTSTHVYAFRGSKDGFLFLMPNGLLWGFKKPVTFIPLDRIVAVSYTNVLRVTFNMVVEFEIDNEGNTFEVEFGMISHQDYDGIDGQYVRRFGLQNRSMAEQRKAKRQLAENAKDGKKKDGGAENGDDDGLTELERANLEVEGQLQDDEDEDEEDYDPGSEGESEGSGTSDDDDEDDEGGDAGDDDGEDSDLPEESFNVDG